MSNNFYSINLKDSAYPARNLELGVNPGMVSDYSLILPNTAPSDDVAMVYNAGTGLFEWRKTPQSDVKIVYSNTEPSIKVDGMFWIEPNNIYGASFWEWDSSNAVWWSNPITYNFEYVVNGSVYAYFNRFVPNSNVRKFVFINATYTFIISVAYSVSNCPWLRWLYINSAAAYITVTEYTATNWTSTAPVYRDNISLSSLNTAGIGRIRYVDNIFTLIAGMQQKSGSTYTQAPYGSMSFTFRHERK